PRSPPSRPPPSRPPASPRSPPSRPPPWRPPASPRSPPSRPLPWHPPPSRRSPPRCPRPARPACRPACPPASSRSAWAACRSSSRCPTSTGRWHRCAARGGRSSSPPCTRPRRAPPRTCPTARPSPGRAGRSCRASTCDSRRSASRRAGGRGSGLLSWRHLLSRRRLLPPAAAPAQGPEQPQPEHEQRHADDRDREPHRVLALGVLDLLVVLGHDVAREHLLAAEPADRVAEQRARHHDRLDPSQRVLDVDVREQVHVREHQGAEAVLAVDLPTLDRRGERPALPLLGRRVELEVLRVVQIHPRRLHRVDRDRLLR